MIRRSMVALILILAAALAACSPSGGSGSDAAGRIRRCFGGSEQWREQPVLIPGPVERRPSSVRDPVARTIHRRGGTHICPFLLELAHTPRHGRHAQSRGPSPHGSIRSSTGVAIHGGIGIDGVDIDAGRCSLQLGWCRSAAFGDHPLRDVRRIAIGDFAEPRSGRSDDLRGGVTQQGAGAGQDRV